MLFRSIEMNNISILLDDQTKILTVSGSREPIVSSNVDVNERDESSGSSKSTRTFSQKFVLRNPTIDINNISATLVNGVLTITLPKISPKEVVKEINVRQIPIMSIKSATATGSTVDDNSKVNDVNDPNVENTKSSVTDSVVAAMSDEEGKATDANLDHDNADDDSPPDTNDKPLV